MSNLHTIHLDDHEIDALAFAADRGYFPAEVWDALATDEPATASNSTPRAWVLTTTEAEPLIKAACAEGFMTCLSETLCFKVRQLIADLGPKGGTKMKTERDWKWTPRQRDEAERLLSDVYDYCTETGPSWDDPTEIVLKLIVERDEARAKK